MTKAFTIFWRNIYYDNSLQILYQLHTTIYEYFSKLMQGKILHDVNLTLAKNGTRICVRYEEFKFK